MPKLVGFPYIDLFEVHESGVFAYASVEEEIAAIARGDRLMAFYPAPLHLSGRGGAAWFREQAARYGLTYHQGHNLEPEYDDGSYMVCISRPEEAWRGPAVCLLWRVRDQVQWSLALERVHGMVVGYPTDQLEQYLTYIRQEYGEMRRGLPAILILSKDVYHGVEECAFRALPPTCDPSELVWLRPARRRLKRNCLELLPSTHTVLRCMVTRKFVESLARVDHDSLACSSHGIGVAQINRSITFGFDVFKDGIWVSPSGYNQ